MGLAPAHAGSASVGGGDRERILMAYATRWKLRLDLAALRVDRSKLDEEIARLELKLRRDYLNEESERGWLAPPVPFPCRSRP